MILQYEIESLINVLNTKDTPASKSAVNVLNRVILDRMEQFDALKQSMLLTSQSSIDFINLLGDYRKLKEANEMQVKEIETLKENIE